MEAEAGQIIVEESQDQCGNEKAGGCFAPVVGMNNNVLFPEKEQGTDNHGDFLEMIANAPIGLWPELEYEGEEIDSIKNRLLFIYTDGLNEAENPQREQFGDDRLLDALRRTRFENAQQVIESLKQEVEAFRNGAEPNDDLTMMCLNVS